MSAGHACMCVCVCVCVCVCPRVFIYESTHYVIWVGKCSGHIQVQVRGVSADTVYDCSFLYVIETHAE